MSKPIKLTDKVIDAMVEEFRAKIKSARLTDGKVSYTQEFAYKKQDAIKVTVLFTPVAYLKMTALLQEFDGEVGWHGTVERKSDDLFLITDILIYPQTVTSTTVTTDQEAYEKWLMGLDDNTFDHLHVQGHSHVNMMPSPSPTDLTHQESILQQLSGDDFYIFMIFNKRMQRTIKIFDFATNTLHENEDVDVGVTDADFDLADFVKQAKEIAKPHVASSPTKPKTVQQSAAINKVYDSDQHAVYPYRGAHYGGSYGSVDYDAMIFGNQYDT